MTDRHQIAALAKDGQAHPAHMAIAAAVLRKPYCPVVTPKLMALTGLAGPSTHSEDAGQPVRINER